MQTYTCCCSWYVWYGVLTSASRVFWLSGHLFLAMRFISEFIWVNVRWNGPTWQAKTIISYFAIKDLVRKTPTSDVPKHVIGLQPTRPISVSTECPFATPNKKQQQSLGQEIITIPITVIFSVPRTILDQENFTQPTGKYFLPALFWLESLRLD